MDKQKLYNEIVSYIKNTGGGYAAWYAGIAANARDRLFNDHNVDEKNGSWVHGAANSSDDAREVEDALHELGCKGGPGGGDNSTDEVYAYFITRSTSEDS